MPHIQIMPSILAANKGHLADECRRAEDAGADGIHIDIMDGHFVPNLSMGPDFVRMAKDAVSIHLSVHLMVSQPDFFAEPFLDAGSDTLILHIEANCDPSLVLKGIRDREKRAGIALNPDTSAQPVFSLAGQLDEVLCMTVNPGFGGQSFIASVLPKIAEIRRILPDIDISVDGGVDGVTGIQCAGAGANILIAGSYLYRSAEMSKSVRDMRAQGESALAKKEASSHS